VESAVVNFGGQLVTLTLADALADNDTLNITALGTNPPVTTSTQEDNITVTPGNGTPFPTTSLIFGDSVSGLTVTPSVLAAGASSTYSVTFRASTTASSGGAIYLSETAGATDFATVSGVLVDDTSRPWQYVATGTSLNDGSAVIPLFDTIDAGDTVTVTLAGVTNPPAGTVTDFAVSTSADTEPVDAPSYAIGASGPAAVTVSVSPSSTGALATYSISNLVASISLAGGSSTITLDGPAGTVFSGNQAYYLLADSTHPSGSGTVSAPVSGGGTNEVTLTVPEAIIAGDRFSITAQDVINPGTASSTDTIDVLGGVTGFSSSGGTTFPDAEVAYPNGSIVDFSGTDYVFAGGHAFDVSSSSLLTDLQKVDHATVQTAAAGATPPTTSPRSGTLVFTRPVNGNATIYVVGTDGDLHGFATPAQFLGDGYDPALVVTVTSVSGLTVGKTAGSEGAAANALSTSADGAIVVSSGAYYVFAGGRAFGVPNPTSLTAIKKADKAKVLSGTVTSAEKSATVANGTLLSTSGLVYVSYGGDLWPFGSQTQLATDGYSGTAALTVPGAGGITVVTSYSGH
jgi:hypothetical protein